jgi:hypothetical protein
MFDRRQLDEYGEPVARQLFTISIGNGPLISQQFDGTGQSALTVDNGIDSSARLP